MGIYIWLFTHQDYSYAVFAWGFAIIIEYGRYKGWYPKAKYVRCRTKPCTITRLGGSASTECRERLCPRACK